MVVPQTVDLPRNVLSAIVDTADAAGLTLIVATTEDPPEILFASRGFLASLGYTRDEYCSRPVRDHIAPESIPGATERRRRRLSGETVPTRFEMWMVRKDGARVPFEVTTTYLDIDGRPGSVSLMHDVSERKASQEKLIQADRLAAVGTLAAGIAHEINNPLAYVLLGLQYLERELPRLASDPEKLRDASARLRDVQRGAERVGTIVRDLKTFARADEVARGPVDLREAIEAALKIADNEIRHRASLVRDYADSPPVQGNLARLEQVFLNLVVNAAHAVSERGPHTGEVRVSVRPAGGGVVAEVRDNGHGIPADVIDRVFDPFFTTKPIGVGTGLGLPICRSIVESFGGSIEISSDQAGTVVRVLLHAYASTVERLPSEAPARVATVPPESRSRILVVDDEPMIGTMLSRALGTQFDIAIATSGHEALSALEEASFDAILCDVMMPGMTGMDVYLAIRSRNPELAERIVFMTGGAFVAGVADFLSTVTNPKLDKPFDWHAVTTTLRSVAQRAAG